MIKRCLSTFVFLMLLFSVSGCAVGIDTTSFGSIDTDIKDTSQILEELTETLDTSDDGSESVEFMSEEYNLLKSDGDTQYAWKFEEDNCALYAMNNDGSDERRLAVFPPLRSEYDDRPTLNYITDFGICGDWIIISVGHYEGSGHYFYGDFVRLKKDGSELEHFWLTEDDKFVIVKDWIYYNFWTAQDRPENVYGCYRIRPDGTDKEYLGDIISSIIIYAEDGYVYGEYATSETVNGWNPVVNLIRCKPDGSGVIILFTGDNLPKFDNSDFISYYDIKVTDEYVSFTARVHGYSEGDSWRGHYVYTAAYRVDKDGNNLVLLSEEYS